MAKQSVLIMGAAGRDFHNFNCLFRDKAAYNVVGFTAAQIPDIDGRARFVEGRSLSCLLRGFELYCLSEALLRRVHIGFVVWKKHGAHAFFP